GESSQGSQQFLSDFWEYDATMDKWTQKADLPFGARTDAIAFAIGDKGYAGTGVAYEMGSVVDKYDFWEYDTTADHWTQKKSCSGRSAAASFSIGDKGYLVGGLYQSGGQTGGGSLQDLWQYDPVNDQWTNKKAMPGSGRGYAMGISDGNYGYVAGGS